MTMTSLPSRRMVAGPTLDCSDSWRRRCGVSRSAPKPDVAVVRMTDSSSDARLAASSRSAPDTDASSPASEGVTAFGSHVSSTTRSPSWPTWPSCPAAVCTLPLLLPGREAERRMRKPGVST